MIRNGLGAMIFKEREEGIFKGMGGGKAMIPWTQTQISKSLYLLALKV